jgi:lysine 2,3-aminomutase
MTPRLDDIWRENPKVHAILKRSPTAGAARRRLFSYLARQEEGLLNHNYDVHPLEWATTLNSLGVLRRVISVRNESLTHFSALGLLHRAARGSVPDDELAPGFKEEFRHLLRAVAGRSRLYAEAEPVAPSRLKGREAALVRSEKLDRLAEHVAHWIARYPDGLDPVVARRRAANRERIKAALGASDEQWADYRWHLRNVIRDAESLGRLVRLTNEEEAAIEAAHADHVPFGVTPHYASLMDFNASRTFDHSVRAQVIPTPHYVRRMVENRGAGRHSLDFMLEGDTSPIELVTRRYPRIAILKPYNTCAQICVYCQRNWEIDEPMAPRATADKRQIDAALAWFRTHPGVTEVLVTGGDPLVPGTGFIERLLEQLAAIDHIERIRIGSRVFVTLPQRVTPRLADAVARFHAPGRREVALVTHIQHVYEVTDDTVRAVQEFRRRGISVYNQLVFTREVSRRFEAAALRRLLRLVGVDPYYTFNTKGKGETVDFRVPIARLLQEQKEEARQMPGLVRTDEAVFNVPGLGKNYVRAGQHHEVIMILADGRRAYEFHPWEKRISLAPTYVETDVGIWEYLEWLRDRGENPRDYRSIWYYY